MTTPLRWLGLVAVTSLLSGCVHTLYSSPEDSWFGETQTWTGGKRDGYKPHGNGRLTYKMAAKDTFSALGWDGPFTYELYLDGRFEGGVPVGPFEGQVTQSTADALCPGDVFSGELDPGRGVFPGRITFADCASNETERHREGLAWREGGFHFRDGFGVGELTALGLPDGTTIERADGDRRVVARYPDGSFFEAGASLDKVVMGSGRLTHPDGRVEVGGRKGNEWVWRCVEGDCWNGTGKGEYGPKGNAAGPNHFVDGVYEGPFELALPHGAGIWTAQGAAPLKQTFRKGYPSGPFEHRDGDGNLLVGELNYNIWRGQLDAKLASGDHVIVELDKALIVRVIQPPASIDARVPPILAAAHVLAPVLNRRCFQGDCEGGKGTLRTLPNRTVLNQGDDSAAIWLDGHFWLGPLVDDRPHGEGQLCDQGTCAPVVMLNGKLLEGVQSMAAYEAGQRDAEEQAEAKDAALRAESRAATRREDRREAGAQVNRKLNEVAARFTDFSTGLEDAVEDMRIATGALGAQLAAAQAGDARRYESAGHDAELFSNQGDSGFLHTRLHLERGIKASKQALELARGAGCDGGPLSGLVAAASAYEPLRAELSRQYGSGQVDSGRARDKLDGVSSEALASALERSFAYANKLASSGACP